MNVKVQIQIVNFFRPRVCFDNSVKYHFINLRIKGNSMLLFAFLQCTIISSIITLNFPSHSRRNPHTILTHSYSSPTFLTYSPPILTHTLTILTHSHNLHKPTKSSHTHTILIHSHRSPTFLTYSPPILTNSHTPHTLTLYNMFFVSRTIRKFSHLRIMISSVYCIQI